MKVRMHWQVDSGDCGAEERVEVLRQADIEYSFSPARNRPRGFDGSIPIEQGLHGLSNERVSSLRHIDFLSVPVKQPFPNTIFNFLNLLGQGGLRDAKPSRSTGDV